MKTMFVVAISFLLFMLSCSLNDARSHWPSIMAVFTLLFDLKILFCSYTK